MSAEHLDVVIVGAGISGIGVAHHLQEKLPHKRYAILEARDAIGGTWDLFRYPGIRSDSDLHTFGYSFRPWIEDRSIADAPSILRYIQRTAADAGIDRHIRFGQRVTAASWSSTDQLWTVDVEDTTSGERRRITTRWLAGATGYYRYEEGYTPEFEGVERFGGPIVHPQHWPEDLDYAGKRVVVIGSGATAVTLIPAMADTAEHVTMLQRTPSYIMALPAVDPIAARFKKWFGPERAHRMAREKNVRIAGLFYKLSRRYPDRVRKLIRRVNEKSLPEGFDIDRHLTPPYDPWDQRMCLVPDGDLFRAIRHGRASIVTDRIRTFTERGLLLESGEELEADIIVTATGLQMQAFGGMELVVDGEPVSLPDTYVYKSVMLTGVPNLSYMFGYTNASWTLRVDLIADYICRLLAYMDERGYGQCVAEPPPSEDGARPLVENFTSGYVQRAIDRFPRQGAGWPWELSMDYVRDRKEMASGPVSDHMRFTPRRGADDDGVTAGSAASAAPSG